MLTSTFTVSLDGQVSETTTSVNGGSWWEVSSGARAVGSPYRHAGAIFHADFGPQRGNPSMDYVGFDGATLATRQEATYNPDDEQYVALGASDGGVSAELNNEGTLVYYFEEATSEWSSNGVIVKVDQFAEHVQFDALALPYPDSTSGDVSRYEMRSLAMSASPSGAILIVNVVYNPQYAGRSSGLGAGATISERNALLVWVIDGNAVIPALRQRARTDGLTVDTQQQRGAGTSQQRSARRGGRVSL